MIGRRHPFDIQDARLIAVLGKYLPPIISRSIVERARREALSGPDVAWTDPNGLLDRISVGVRLFAQPEQVAPILREITDLAVADHEDGPLSQRIGLDVTPASSKKPPISKSHHGPITARAEGEHASTRTEAPSAARSENAAPSRGESVATPRTDVDRPDPSLGTRREQDAAHRRSPTELPVSSRGIFATSTKHTSPSPGPTHPTAAGSSPIPPGNPTPAAPPPQNRTGGTPPAGTARVTIGSAGARHQPAPAIPPGYTSVQRSGTPGGHGIVPRAPAAPSRAEIFGRAPPLRETNLKETTIALNTEHDIPLARQVAREICEQLGTRALTQQRLLTIVSELGRNMVLYAGGGRITLRPPNSKSRRIVVMAVDQGSGIPNLQEIMSGKYKSRSGLGLGLLGTKRLADTFHIETGRTGTTVIVEVIL
ncbi:MAG: hypothetical protein IPK82_06400 [Polyangiaceae bacterium]|nr:hypothetical protein [Polyangiaceae bacterium]